MGRRDEYAATRQMGPKFAAVPLTDDPMLNAVCVPKLLAVALVTGVAPFQEAAPPALPYANAHL